MPELLLELGTEELPASFVRKAYSDLLAEIESVLSEAGVLVSPGTSMGTPRRQIVSIPDVLDRQPDTTKEMRGPALKSAYDATGNPTQALLGFCRGQGVDPSDLRRDEQYVWVSKAIPGRPTAEILQEMLPKAIRSLSFEKSMRWGSARMRFARPIRWILAAFDGEPVAFEIEGVASGVESRGHRFYAPEPFEARTYTALIEGLRARHVEPDAERRRAAIEAGARAVAQGAPEISASLLEENTFLTEWPTAIQGTFKEEFMSLPEPVLVTAMAKHEKMFPVRDGEGRLTNRFVFVRNSGEDDTVRAGCEWVLNARFNDANFFFQEDSKHKLEDFLARTETILFQEKLGSVRQRSERLAKLAGLVARATGADDAEASLAERAGRYSKADLATGLVSELSSLQGVIGGEYARRESFPPEVAHAIAAQYDPGRIGTPTDAAGRTAVRLVITDALDKLAGYLGQGLAPTGSSDPFALRRAATVLIESAWNWPAPFPPYGELVAQALAMYSEQGVELNDAGVLDALGELFATRYSALLPDVRYDILEAAVQSDDKVRATVPRAVRFRTRVLTALAADILLIQTLTRPLNIVAAAKKKGIPFAEIDPLAEIDLTQLDSAPGSFLFETLCAGKNRVARGTRDEDVEDVVAFLRSLAEPINQFFEGTMVMVEDAEIRHARLSLLHGCALLVLEGGDFSQLVIEG